MQQKIILLVEDNEINREIAWELLSMAGLEVACAVDGRQAVELFQENPPDTYSLILMDIQMPEMDGYEAVARIREAERGGPRIPIIAMTAHAMESERQRSLDAGMNDHLDKPIVPAALVAALLRWRLQPLVALSREARRIADNPLSQWVYCGRNDSFGQIAFALRSLEAESGAMVGRIADSARQLNEDVGELAAAVDCSRGASVQQQRETEQVASAVEQLAASVQEVARHAQLSASAAAEANQATDSGLRQVEQTRRQIAALADEVLQGNQVIQRLQAHSQEIDQVIEVIHGIAEQTNLLALNAAIEAARAGEAGRGFAVVADEVRGLASRTQQSTAQIQAIIERLQQGTTAAVAAMQRSQMQAEGSVDNALQAAEALSGINLQVEAISGMSLQIATAVEEQSAVGEDIQRNLDGIREAGQSTVAASGRSRHSAEHVASLVERLQLLAEQFRGNAQRG